MQPIKSSCFVSLRSNCAHCDVGHRADYRTPRPRTKKFPACVPRIARLRAVFEGIHRDSQSQELGWKQLNRDLGKQLLKFLQLTLGHRRRSHPAKNNSASNLRAAAHWTNPSLVNVAASALKWCSTTLATVFVASLARSFSIP